MRLAKLQKFFKLQLLKVQFHKIIKKYIKMMGRDSSVGIATRYGVRMPVGGEIFRIRPDRPWGPSSLLYGRYRVCLPG